MEVPPDVAVELAALRSSVETLAQTVGRQSDTIASLSARLSARDDDTLTGAEVCAVLHIGRTKLTELVASGALPMWKLGGDLRITRAGLSAYIRRCATRVTADGPRRTEAPRSGTTGAAKGRGSRTGEVRRG